MSETDNRVVQMQFNNKQFESGVKTSIDSIDNLKKSLEFSKSTKNLDDFQRSINSVSMEGMSDGILHISSKMSALGVMTATVIQNMTNSALNFGKRVISSFTIDPIKTGLSEYETKINAIQTILTNTQGKGTTLTDVNAALAELNEYADKTIYNFGEMTKNIGTFTAAGIDLDTSTKAIKGIANLAAGSGSTSQQASTAMYQLSQALASGSVKLQDWNSVVNAGMGGQLFQNALKESAKELGVFVDESKPFRESLESGWITTDVLTKTLQKFAEDESLIEAATQVKTFTQMVSTMKESVQSGWALSWEYILGDKNEAAELFTAIYEGFNTVMGASADARNEMLLFWKDNGGRAAILQAISNVLIGLADILEPIEEAFSELFPPMTGKRLVALSTAFKNLTDKFKMSEGTMNNIKRTFKGLFAIVDIGVQVIKSIGKAFGSVIKYLLPVSDGLLSVTGSIGDYIVAIDKSLKSSDAFNRFFGAIGKILKPIADMIKKFASVVKNAFSALFGSIDIGSLDGFVEKFENALAPFAKVGNFVSKIFGIVVDKINNAISAIGKALSSIGGTDTSDINTLSSNVQKGFEPLTKIGDFINGAFSKISNVVKKVTTTLAPVFNKLKDTAGMAFGEIGSAMSEALRTGDFSTIIEVLNGGIFATILLAIRKFIKSLTGVSKSAKGSLDGIKGTFDGIKKILDGVKGCLTEYQNSLKADILKKIAVAIAILAASLLVLSLIDPNMMTKSIIAISTLFGELVGSMAIFSKIGGGKGFDSMGKMVVGLIGISVAILLLSVAVAKLAEIDYKDLYNGLLGVGALCIALTIPLKNMNSSIKGVVGLAVAILLLVVAVKQFGGMDTNSLIQGLIGVGVMLTEIALFMKLTKDSKGLIATSAGMAILAIALGLLSNVIVKIADIPTGQLAKGLLGMAGAILVVCLAMKTLPKGGVVSSLALLGFVKALENLSLVMASMGGLSLEEIGKALLVLAGSLTIICVAMTAMTGTLPGAAALLIASAALVVLYGALKLLGNMSLIEIGVALLALVGVFAVLGLSALVLSPLIPVILLLSGAMGLLGIACLAIGAGLVTFAAGMAALALSGAAGSAALAGIVLAIVATIPAIATALAMGVITFIKTIASGVGEIITALKSVFNDILSLITDVAPKLAETICSVILTILKTILEYIPQITETAILIVNAFVQGIADNIEGLVTALLDIVINIIDGIAAKLPDLIHSLVNLVIQLVNGVADALNNDLDPLLDAVGRVIAGLAKGIGKILGKLIEVFVDIGIQLVKGLIKGITGAVGKVKDAVVDLGKSAVGAVKKFLGIHSPSKLFREIGENIGKGLTNGITGSTDGVAKASEDMADVTTKATSQTVTKSNEAAKSAFDKAVEWIDERKYYNKLSLQDELKEWQKLQAQYAKGTEERKKADREAYRVKNEIIKKEYDDAIQGLDDKKYYNKLTLEEELEAYQTLQKKYKKGSEERIKIDKEVYRIKKEMRDADFDDAVAAMDDLKYYDKLPLEDELAGWKALQKKYKKGTEERIEADKEVYRIKKEMRTEDHDEELEIIDDLKYYDKLSLKDELKAYLTLQKKYKKGTDERKQMDKEVYRVKKEILAKQEELDQEYYDKTQEINEKTKQDIQDLTDAYTNAVDERSEALYSSYGLFDKVEPEEDPLSGFELLSNLETQVKAFDEWTASIEQLANRGIDPALIDELQAMGPEALSKIKALNGLSEPALQRYVELWKEKHIDAKTQALKELDDLRVETDKKIEEINSQTEIDLEELKTTWETKINELNGTTKEQMSELTTTVTGTASTVVKDTKKIFKDVAKEIEGVEWATIGTNIVKGIQSGMNKQSESLAKTAAKVAKAALKAAEKALGIKSPSKEFEKVGMYADEGLAMGLDGFSRLVTTSASNVGTMAIDSLKTALSKVNDSVNMNIDSQPTIRPVIDMSNVENGLASAFDKSRGISVDATINKAHDVSTSSHRNYRSDDKVTGSTDNINSSNIQITNNYTVRNDEDIKRISRDLNTTINRYNLARGVATI